jgi:hypothetical protein
MNKVSGYTSSAFVRIPAVLSYDFPPKDGMSCSELVRALWERPGEIALGSSTSGFAPGSGINLFLRLSWLRVRRREEC